MKLTIGMCCFDDFEGVYWSIQAIRLYHPEVLSEVEFLVLDNNPDSAQGQAVERFSKWVKQPIRYIQVKESAGTALRSRIFDLAQTPYVLCMDSHVMLIPGSLRQLINGMEAGMDGGNLLQGPMLGDNLEVMATHMAYVWRSGMLGIWAIAWRCQCGHVFQTSKREDGAVNWLECQTLMIPHRAKEECLCGKSYPVVHWEGHEIHLEQSGFERAIDGSPFEIPAQGLGLFACRKDAWLGFHPEFRHFGGEECYIHEKYRQAGSTTICLPFLKWLHRFERPNGVPYTAPWESRIMNYLLGHRELGWEPALVLEHFAYFLKKQIRVEWDQQNQPLQVSII